LWLTQQFVPSLRAVPTLPTMAWQDDSEETSRWRVHGERLLYDNKWVRLAQVDVEPPSGERWWHHVVRLRPIAAAIVLDEHDRVLMLWRHRFVPDSFAWELPGGMIDGSETGAMTAVRETEEETGWRPVGQPEHLCTFEPMPGMVEARHEVYLIRGAEHVGEPTELHESGRVMWMPLAEILDHFKQGELAGAASLVGLLYLLNLRSLEY